MKKTTGLLLLPTILWLLFAATPRPSTIQLVGNVTPTCSTTTGVCTLPDAPKFSFLILTMNGVTQKLAEDYTISGATITPVPANVDLYSDPATIKVAFYAK